MTSSGATLRGIERLAVFNRLRAAFGLRWELPPLLSSVVMPIGSQCLEIGTGLGWGTVGLLRKETSLAVVTTDYESPILQWATSFLLRKPALDLFIELCIRLEKKCEAIAVFNDASYLCKERIPEFSVFRAFAGCENC